MCAQLAGRGLSGRNEPCRSSLTVEEECTAFGMACFGVRVRSGEFKQQRPESITHLSGGSLAECLQAAKLPQSALQDAAVGFQKLAAFVELHIEQGADFG